MREVAEIIEKLKEFSPYAAAVAAAQEQTLSIWLETGRWASIPVLNESSFSDYLATPELAFNDYTEEEARAALRKFRNFYSAYILWHDYLGNLEWRELFRLQSELADICMGAAQAYVEHQSTQVYSLPTDSSGSALQLGVVAMGKWGGMELNFSSDIDYIYLYSESGELKKLNSNRIVSHHEYFLKQAQKINQLLGDVTQDGFVYRCDTRLRPFGESGPLVVSLAALEQYLLEHGREWERYAYLKARCVSGDQQLRDGFAELCRPFVYRRYLDYGVYENLRDMHHMISGQVSKKRIEDDLKLGRGGIRECEFLVQSYQLIRGGRNPELQHRNFYDAYQSLLANGILNDDQGEFVRSYIFLRLLENRLQALHQEQTHMLPENLLDRKLLLQAMQMDNWEALEVIWNKHRNEIEQRFDLQSGLFERNRHLGTPSAEIQLIEERRKFATLLGPLAGTVENRMDELLQSVFYRRLDDSKKRLVDQVLTEFLNCLSTDHSKERYGQAELATIVDRFFAIVVAIGQRKTYFLLLNEHPQSLKNLVWICSHSGFIAAQIAEHPVLLDELLDQRVFQQVPTMESVFIDVQKLQNQLVQLDPEEFAQQLQLIKNTQVFRIALADVMGHLTIMKVSDCLTALAESVLSLTLDYVDRHALKKFDIQKGGWRESGFTVVAYGKLGGLEMSYSSDLDVVFLFDDKQEKSLGINAADSSIAYQYYHRLAQQCMRILALPTVSGRLYEVDTRLRPSGYSGFLVNSFEAYKKYMQEDAWSWEHQALNRARAILGSTESINRFSALRINILTQYIQRDRLKAEVIEMRNKMRAEHDNVAQRDLFHLKHSRGGIIDIEFLVQYLLLVHAQDYPELVEYSDNVRQLESLAHLGKTADTSIRPDDAEVLIEAYLSLRKKIHALALEDKAAVVEKSAVTELINPVLRIWHDYLENAV